MTNNHLENVSKGVLICSFDGNPSLGETVKITDNVVRNIRSVSDRAGFVQFNRVRNIIGVEIAFNQVVNEPGASKVEDNINIYNSY